MKKILFQLMMLTFLILVSSNTVSATSSASLDTSTLSSGMIGIRASSDPAKKILIEISNTSKTVKYQYKSNGVLLHYQVPVGLGLFTVTVYESTVDSKVRILLKQSFSIKHGDINPVLQEIAIANNVISWQLSHGGWGKNNDDVYIRKWDGVETRSGDAFSVELGSIDNGATVYEIRYLIDVYNKTGNVMARIAALKGVNFLLNMQHPTGAIPQVYPRLNHPKYPYFDAGTFNDDATVNVMALFRDILRNRQTMGDNIFEPTTRQRVQVAFDRGLDFILKSQIVVNNKLTAWCAQHDPITYRPIKAREYELVSISGYESVGVVKFLISLGSSDPRVVTSVNSAIAWFNQVAVKNTKYNRYATNGKYFEPSSGNDMWYRFYDINTNKAFFANRDGSKVYDIMHVLKERRDGYVWAGNWGKDIIKYRY